MDKSITIPYEDYKNLLKKSVKFDLLTSMIQSRIDEGDNYPVNDNVVMELTGTAKQLAARKRKEKESVA